MEPSDKAKRWREYFIDLLNAEIPVNKIRKAHYQTAEPMISDITLDEVKVAINSLKNWKLQDLMIYRLSLLNTGAKKCTRLSSKHAKRLGK